MGILLAQDDSGIAKLLIEDLRQQYDVVDWANNSVEGWETFTRPFGATFGDFLTKPAIEGIFFGNCLKFIPEKSKLMNQATGHQFKFQNWNPVVSDDDIWFHRTDKVEPHDGAHVAAFHLALAASP